MAASVKDKEVIISKRLVTGTLKKLQEQAEAIETSKAQHMNRAGRIKDTMTAIYESAAAEGLPQRVVKTHFKIQKLQSKIEALYAELEAEHQVLLHKAVKAHADPVQLTMFKGLPAPKIKPLTAAEKKAKAEAEAKAEKTAKADTAAATKASIATDAAKAGGELPKPATEAKNGKADAAKPSTPGATGEDIDKAIVKAGGAAVDAFKPLH
jgi:uncharacterized protein (UPF0335 family)